MPFFVKTLALNGARYGRFVVIKEIEHPRYEVQCDCGRRVIRSIADLRRKRALFACGCYRKEIKTTHGHTADHIVTPTYRSWLNMNNRCNNPRNSRFGDYGGRGIVICERWMKFENFFADMGEQPKGLQIERIDNDGNYEPSNCKWATRLEQANNRRSNKMLTLNGESKLLKLWTKDLGLGQHTIRDRIRRGLSMERVLTSAGRKPRLPGQTPRRAPRAPENVTAP
jgi:hypothetical protein